MARHKLTDTRIKARTEAGIIGDGDGLFLRIKGTGTKSWVFVWRKDGKRHELGFGAYASGTRHVTLARARLLADEARAILGTGGDPKTEMSHRKAVVKQVTFGRVADEYIETMAPKWKGGKTKVAFERFANQYAAALREMPVSSIATEDIVTVLRPLWTEKPETGRKVRERIKSVLDHAKARGLRSGDNPAEWKGHLDQILPSMEKLTKGHHPAMPYADVPAFVAKIRRASGVGARAVEFTILTAARAGETRHAVWSEIDLDEEVWTVPAARMKAGKMHRVPLSARAVAILREMQKVAVNDLVFPGQREDRPVSDMTFGKVLKTHGAGDFTVHGFRSSFRDWAGNETDTPREVAEAALAHSVGDSVELAYRRGDALAKRRKLMDLWDAHCEGGH
ncbi:integrase [Aureimonas sp. Leaf454]|uniref:tyrosine-type recombinase/integrase n=1 Tax=Aureimonas sp. Leaf454 TaxID=1736381 RepID=UPI0006F62084|nr:integrase arm-type DNA-binding domain-containing protein [Aureimonas sp. Leaf454]KQT48949.1 integrase [Aureimonas sp. Leaf454]